jgi:ketosteroid isomerase-like protein
LVLCACRAPAAGPSEETAVAAVLDDWHRAASRADGERYFGHMAPDAVFLGTDAGERWTLGDFRAFCEPYFSRGIGWTYEPRERYVVVAGDVAWLDERLWNDKYGDCRGTGVLRRREGVWRIVHYSLTLLVPNERAAEVVELLRGR